MASQTKTSFPKLPQKKYFSFFSSLLFVIASILLLIIALRSGFSLEKLNTVKEAMQNNKKVPYKDAIKVGIFLASLINCFFCIIFLFFQNIFREYLPRGIAKTNRACSYSIYIFLFITIILTLFLRIPLASKSLWIDEAWNTKYISGYYKVNDNEIIYKESSIKKAFYDYNKPTNHYLFATSSHILLRTYQKLFNLEKSSINELVIRLPNILASIASILFIFLFLKEAGFPKAGLFAGLLLAIHPWHIRYGIDARGFSYQLLLTISSLYFLLRAIHLGKWKHYLILSLNIALLMINSILSFWHCLFLFLAGIFLAGKNYSDKSSKNMARKRILVANLLSFMIFLQFSLPHIIQVFGWEKLDTNNYLKLNKNSIEETVSQVLFGMPKELEPSRENHTLPAFTDFLEAPFPLKGILLLISIIVLAGFFRLYRDNKLASNILLFCLLSFIPFFAITYYKNLYYYPRYSFSILIPFCLFIGTAFAPLKNMKRQLSANRILKTDFLFFLIFFIPYFFVLSSQIKILLNHPYQPYKNIAQYFKEKEKYNEKAIIGAFGLGSKKIAEIYYPKLNQINSLKSLISLINKSKEEKKPFFFTIGQMSFHRGRFPKVVEFISEKRNSLRIVKTFYGIVPSHTYYIYKYDPSFSQL